MLSSKLFTPNHLGVLYALLAYGSWGLVPLYWKHFGTVPALEILGHRMVWSSLLLVMALAVQQNLPELKKLLVSPRRWLPLLLTSAILSLNWGLYIYGVSTSRIVETSLGYFINPLVNVLLGVLILKERLTWGQKGAVFLAALGVLNSVLMLGQIPWLALTLAVSFGFYGLLRKLIPVSPLVGLTMETCLLTPVAIAYLVFLNTQHASHFAQNPTLALLFIGGGVVTSLPLLWFNNAAQRLRLSTLGFFQYLAPSLQLGIGVLVYHEPFTQAHLATFGLIWAALALYSVTSVLQNKAPLH
jgi:chloramphenicol-sensitive protein RarD